MSGTGKTHEAPQFLLSRIQMLAGLPEESLERLEDYFETVELDTGETLFKQGEAGDSLYVVKSGSMDVLMHNDDGRIVKTAALQRGECFGELSAIDCQPRSASTVASARTVLLKLSKERLMDLMSAYPVIAKNLLMLLCSRIRVSDVRLISFEWLANVDKLTGLYNRRWFDTILEHEFQRSRRYSHPLSLLMMDIDNFKQVNDTYGHLTGDRVLQQLSNTIRGGTRSTDLLARYGGEEFAIVLPDTQVMEAASVAERFRKLVENRVFLDIWGNEIGKVTVSIGVGERGELTQPYQIANKVDQALYLAKRSGRNCVKMYED